jgi:hypothetical protein
MSDETELLLRRALRAEADAADPSTEGLVVIRRRIAAGAREPRRPWTRYGIPLVAAVAAGAVVVAGVSLATSRSPRNGSPAPAPPAAVPTAGPSGTPSVVPPDDGSGSSAAHPTGSAAVPQATFASVPVYAIRLNGSDGRLVREFRTVPARGDRAASAVAALALAPVDPDYTTFWRRPSRVDVDVLADRIVVDLSHDAFGNTNIGTAVLPAVAIQQLVWTVTAATGKNLPVSVLVDGRTGYLAWDSVRLGSPMQREIAHRAPVWVDSPADRGVLRTGTQHVTGQGSGFEATFIYRVTSGSRVVTHGFVTGSPAGDSYGWWTFDIPLHLAAGSYTITVTADNPSTEGTAGADDDTKRFTVR